MTPTIRFLLALLVVASLSTCAPRGTEPARRFQLTGTVAGNEPCSGRVVIAHDAVDGLMPAMSMPFDIRGVPPSVREGDRIAATLVVTSSRSWLENVRITAAAAGVARAGSATTGQAAPGVIVPALPLKDQNGRSLTLRDFTGRVLVITFIYTRCPLPDACPLMVKHLERVRRRAIDERIGERGARLGVTLDPGFDTPAVLRS